ncbi:MAG: DUF2971 domain-containing protein [Anaerolineales bacterium]|nr:DUF2971 domain-containing protein [Anaerolineales bacterium]
MRVYHFVNKEYGIEDIKKRRLKIATLNELNDPFEFFGINLSDPSVRHAFRKMKDELSVTRGLLCFSRSWQNPVQWSHYADKHRGLCLGFEVPDEKLGPVSYSRKRLVVETERLLAYRELDPEIITKFLFTKYAHWKYENEVRYFATLEEMDSEKNMYFADFSDNLKLVQVIVGAESTLTRADVYDALGNLAPRVEAFKSRLAFKSFRVVRQQNQKLWV